MPVSALGQRAAAVAAKLANLCELRRVNGRLSDQLGAGGQAVLGDWTNRTDQTLVRVVADQKMLAGNDQKQSNGTISGATAALKCFWPKCQFRCGDARLLKEHYSVHQKTKNQFRCDALNCQKTFKYKQNLIQHKLSHKSGPKADIGQKLQLIRQNKTVEAQPGLVVAHKSHVLSSKMSDQNQNQGLVIANKSVPVRKDSSAAPKKPKDKRFICDHSGCDKCFDSKSNLERHKRIHSGEKPFGCDIAGCGQRFTQKTHLVQHKKRKHRIILPKNAIKLIKPLDSYGNPIEPPAPTPAVKTPVQPQAVKTVVQTVQTSDSYGQTDNGLVFAPTIISTPMVSAPVLRPEPSATPVSAAKTAAKTMPTTPVTTRNANNRAKALTNSAKTVANAVTSAAKTPNNRVNNTSANSETAPKTPLNANQRQYKCYATRCHNSYDSLYELKTHVNSVHPNDSLTKCTETNCNQVFKSFYNLYYHKKTFHKL